MRPVFITNTSTAANVPYNPDAGTRIVSVVAHARAGNAGYWYLSGSSGLSSAAGFELAAGEKFEASYEEMKGSVKGASFWCESTSSGDVIDWAFTVED